MPAHDAQQPHAGPEEIAADLARQRAELGRTVDELAERFDLKKLARRRGREVGARAREFAASAANRMRGPGAGRHVAPLAPAELLLPAVLLGAGITLIVRSRRR